MDPPAVVAARPSIGPHLIALEDAVNIGGITVTLGFPALIVYARERGLDMTEVATLLARASGVLAELKLGMP